MLSGFILSWNYPVIASRRDYLIGLGKRLVDLSAMSGATLVWYLFLATLLIGTAMSLFVYAVFEEPIRRLIRAKVSGWSWGGELFQIQT